MLKIDRAAWQYTAVATNCRSSIITVVSHETALTM